MENVRAKLVSELINPDVPRWRRVEERLAAQITADSLLRRFPGLITSQNAKDYAALEK